MQELLTLTQTEFTLLAVICFCAGLVRGFTGFALSAIVMASAALILSPLALIPICWWLEIVASAMMVRGGWKDADKDAAVTLWLGSAIAVPIGLYFTQNVSAELSQTVALCLILVLAVTQLANMRLAFLNTRHATHRGLQTARAAARRCGMGCRTTLQSPQHETHVSWVYTRTDESIRSRPLWCRGGSDSFPQ